MSKRLIPLLLIFLLFTLMGTPVQAMDCEWVSKLKTDSGTDMDVSDEGYLESPILREEYEQFIKNIASYSVCMDKEIKKILSEMASSATEGTDRVQLILTLEEKLRDLKNADENINLQFLQQEQQYNQFREEVASSDETFKELIESLELAHATQMKVLEGDKNKLELKLKSTANKIRGLSKRLADTGSKMDTGLSDLSKTLAAQIRSLEGVDNELESKLKSTANQIMELSARLTDTDNKIGNDLSGLKNTLSDKTLYGIISILIVTLLVIFLFMFLRKSVFKQKTDLNRSLEGVKKEIEEESIRLDNKLISLIETQLSTEGSKESNSGEKDHSLALKVADEIVRIQKNTSRMDTKTKGLKQLVASVKRIQDNFSSNGYDIVEMLDQPYDEGMNASVNFILDEDLNENEQVITKIIKPQVNYQGVMIQAAQIEVSKGE